MKTAFITGFSGFVGNHLLAHLRVSGGWQLAGLDWGGGAAEAGFYSCDLHDAPGVQRALQETRPDVVFHLAGVLKSDDLGSYYRTHVFGTIALLEALLKTGLRPRVVIFSSSAVYGSGRGRRPITEAFRPRPITHYAVSKLAQEFAAFRYHTAFGLPVLCVRTFNLLGPGLSPVMACSDFARQIAQAEKRGRPATISTGNLDARRDFVDVRDAVRAYALLAEKGRPGQVYNVASGRAVSIRECLDLLREQTRVPIETVVDPARVQQNDIPVQVGSAERLRRLTGWKPEISVEQSLVDLLEDWRQKVKTE